MFADNISFWLFICTVAMAQATCTTTDGYRGRKTIGAITRAYVMEQYWNPDCVSSSLAEN